MEKKKKIGEFLKLLMVKGSRRKQRQQLTGLSKHDFLDSGGAPWSALHIAVRDV